MRIRFNVDLWDLWVLLLGATLAFFVDSALFCRLHRIRLSCPSNSNFQVIGAGKQRKYAFAVIKANIFKVEVKKKLGRIELYSKGKAHLNDTLNGYKLVGIVAGDNPMALFKKGDSPVEIVTKDKPLGGRWFLRNISKRGITLINRDSGEEKFFSLRFMKELNEGKQITDTGSVYKVKLPKSEVSKIVENPSPLLAQINISPYTFKGMQGYRVNWVASNSIFRKIGLRSGDVIVRVNGESVADVNRLILMYGSIPDMDTLTVDIIRDGKPRTLLIEVE